MINFLLRQIYRLTKDTTIFGSSVFLPVPSWLNKLFVALQMPLQKRVATLAVLLKGQDLTISAPNELGCAESVSRILKTILMVFPVVTSTIALFELLESDKRFVRTTRSDVKEGSVVIAVTGQGNNKTIKHGHAGIVGKNGVVWSNNSKTGTWDCHLSVNFFYSYYTLRGGYPLYYYNYR